MPHGTSKNAFPGKILIFFVKHLDKPYKNSVLPVKYFILPNSKMFCNDTKSVSSALSWGVDIAVAQEQLNLERAVENIGIQQANIRAGAGGNRSGRSTY